MKERIMRNLENDGMTVSRKGKRDQQVRPKCRSRHAAWVQRTLVAHLAKLQVVAANSRRRQKQRAAEVVRVALPHLQLTKQEEDQQREADLEAGMFSRLNGELHN